MSKQSEIAESYLAAQSVFDRFIRQENGLESYSRIGFMATEICLILLEDTTTPMSDVCMRIACVFQVLSKQCLKAQTSDAPFLASTFSECESATMKLTTEILTCRNRLNTS